jgi:hypothetical protein
MYFISKTSCTNPDSGDDTHILVKAWVLLLNEEPLGSLQSPRVDVPTFWSFVYKIVWTFGDQV